MIAKYILHIDIFLYYTAFKMDKIDLHVSKRIASHNIILTEKIKIKSHLYKI